MNWLKLLSAADIITLGNGLFGLLAITYIIDQKYMIASLFIFYAILLDGLDGIAARRFGSKHHFGKNLDSFADSISFCIAPALLVYGNFYNMSLGSAWKSFPNALAVISALLLVSAGLLRLSKYTSDYFNLDHYLGLPAPVMTFAILMICTLFGSPEKSPFSLGHFPYLVFSFVFILSILMMIEIPYPKLDRLILLVTTVVYFLVPPWFIADIFNINIRSNTIVKPIMMIGLITPFIYIIFGPKYQKSKSNKFIK